MDFLQSEIWRKFQASLGRKTFVIEKNGFIGSIIEHQLPIMGKYFYLPYGPVISLKNKTWQEAVKILLDLSKKENIKWIRFEPETEKVLTEMKKNISFKIKKTDRNVQPQEIFVIDLKKDKKTLLAEMKSKTRYNIKLAEKKGVKVKMISFESDIISQKEKKYQKEFIRLTQIMARRNGITAHPAIYYEKMMENIPKENLKLFVAEYAKKIIAMNLVIFYEKTAIYLHGASDDCYRNVMAPFLLQWKQIQVAKELGCEEYNLGGVSVKIINPNWEGITRFKTGFSVVTVSRIFPGTFDLILDENFYRIYFLFKKIRDFFKKLKSGFDKSIFFCHNHKSFPKTLGRKVSPK